ncbi:MAG: glycoside hydrolase family 3 C-terminal domain-containing protein [Acidobacteriaceae bacterium]
MHKIGLVAVFVSSVVGAVGQQPRVGVPATAVYADSSAPVEARITDLLSRMTLEEKVDAFSTDPTVPRLGVVGTGHVEGLHGLALGGPAHWEGRAGRGYLTVIPTTIFPQARGLGQTWDPALLTEAAAEEAYETRYAFGKYHRGGLVVRAPNADLSRDPRWGRSEESYGEDPYLVGTLATAYTRGLQGDGKYWTTASLLKHFLANSNENLRTSSSSDFDERLFQEYYSVPFRMAIEDGHANAFMTAYNSWNGTPMIENPVLRNVVMKVWGEDGIICTDGGALTALVKDHHAFKTMPEAVAATVHAGINQYLDDYKPAMEEALKEGLINEQDLDRNLRGVFRVMIKLGMLDPAELVPQSKIGVEDGAGKGSATMLRKDPWWTAQPKALARRVTDESIVLLKNASYADGESKSNGSDGSKTPMRALLPLDAAKLKSLAVVGPYANEVLLDWYSGTPPFTVTPLEGIRARVGAGVKVTYAKGDDLAAVTALAKTVDAVVVLIGNNPTCGAGWNVCPTPSDGKEAIDRKSMTLEQESIAKAALAGNARTVVVLQASFPYTTNWTEANVPAILEMTNGSEEQGDGLADVLFGDYDPAGRLTQTWVKDEADLPPMMDYNIRDGRTYMYAKQTPLYAFGFGLSYTSFAYSHLRVSAATLRDGQTATVSVEVKNTGERAGDEVVQMYVSHEGSKVARPVEELEGFARVSLKAGETKTVTLPLAAKALEYWSDDANAFVLEKDRVVVKVGGSSDDLPVKAVVQVM